MNPYAKFQNDNDSTLQLSVRAIRSVLLYCKDVSDNYLSPAQRYQSAMAGNLLCNAMIMNMNQLPEEETRILTTILRKTAEAFTNRQQGSLINMIPHERALIKILDIIDPNQGKGYRPYTS